MLQMPRQGPDEALLPFFVMPLCASSQLTSQFKASDQTGGNRRECLDIEMLSTVATAPNQPLDYITSQSDVRCCSNGPLAEAV